MRYGLSLLLLVLLMSCRANDQAPVALPTPTSSDFSSDVPPEWISWQLKQAHYANLHTCPSAQATPAPGDLAIEKRLIEIYSWKSFVALNWPTVQKVDQRALDDKWYAEASGASLADAITAALKILGERSEDDVQVELLSDAPQFKVGVTRCINPNAKWIPLNGSVWAASTGFVRSQIRITSANCPRWMTWHTRQDFAGPQGFAPRTTPLAFCDDNPEAGRNILSTFALSDFNHLSDVDVPGIQYPLVDQNGNKVYYDIAMNDVSYCALKRTALHAHVPNGPQLDFPPGESSQDLGDLPGSTELKFAWKILRSDKDDPTRFITRVVTVPDDNIPGNLGKDCAANPAQCVWKKARVGLVGMHIVHKSRDHTSWIWTTFEQVDNAPDEDSLESNPGAKRKFSFYGDASTSVHNSLGVTQLTRTQKIAPDTAQLNDEVHQLLKNQDPVLQYYQLVGTQYDSCNYASDEDATKNATPHLLRNTVIEPYLAQTSSCIGCHSTAALSQSCCTEAKCNAGFSFLASGLSCVVPAMMPAGGSPAAGARAKSP
jgi:hypothetical protein